MKPLPAPSAPVKRGRQTAQEKLQRLIQQQSELAGQMKILAAQQRADARARQLQLERMIGVALRSNEAMREFVQEALVTHFGDDAKSISFLRSEGWIK